MAQALHVVVNIRVALAKHFTHGIILDIVYFKVAPPRINIPVAVKATKEDPVLIVKANIQCALVPMDMSGKMVNAV